MKNKIISILCIFILISFCFINNCVLAYDMGDFPGTPDVATMNYVFSTNEYKSGVYNVIFYQIFNSSTNYTLFFDKNLNITPVVEWSEEYSCYIFSMGSLSETFDFVRIQNGIYRNEYTNDYINSVKVGQYFYSDCPVYNKTTNSYFIANGEEEEPEIIYPAISNTAEDLSTGTFDYILVAPGTFSNTENIGLNIYNITNLEENGDVYSQNPIFSTVLNSSSSFYKAIVVEDQTEFWFEIPRANLNIDFKNGNTYLYSLTLDGSPIQEIQATIGGLTQEDILNNNFDNLQTSIKESNKELQSSIDKQTEAIKENNKTNKNIFEKIGEILSYLNPFSENFFAYKLVELIIEGLKSLFVPSDDFLSNWLDDLNEYFGDTFGILYYPFELLVDFLNRVGNIAETNTAIISVPSFTLSFMDYSATFFEDMSYDLNTILENDTFKNIHDIYLIFTDIILWLGVIYLAAKMLRSIFGGMGDEVQSRVEDSQEGERSYERYKQYQENKKRYKQENKGR